MWKLRSWSHRGNPSLQQQHVLSHSGETVKHGSRECVCACMCEWTSKWVMLVLISTFHLLRKQKKKEKRKTKEKEKVIQNDKSKKVNLVQEAVQP